jgi:hypothetical protein
LLFFYYSIDYIHKNRGGKKAQKHSNGKDPLRNGDFGFFVLLLLFF